MWAIVCGFLAATFITGGCLGSSPAVLVNNTRIVGGEEVDIRNVPYQVSIQYNNNHFCGGAFITNDTVISAAHCFGSSYPSISSLYTVKYGSNTTQGSSRIITSVLVHEKYNSETIDYDISLIKLSETIELSETVSLIRLSENSQYTWDSLATVSGWGYEEENGAVTQLLRKVDVPLVQPSACRTYYSSLADITNNMLCAGYLEGGKDACQGDSGGPLVQDNKLIGIVSFGMGCARPSYPGVYSNVAELASWVAANSDYTLNGSSNIRLNGAWTVTVMLTLLATLFQP